jgi:hypothetical protein
MVTAKIVRVTKNNMATKVQLLKVLKETCPLPRACVRRPSTKPVGLYMLQLRSHVIETSSPKFKLAISADPNHGPDSLPQPVKITHT